MKKHDWKQRNSGSFVCGECGHDILCLVHEGGGMRCRGWRTPCEVDAAPQSQAKGER